MDAVDFFHKYAGCSRLVAEDLAHAERFAEQNGWKFVWEDDPEGWNKLGDAEDPSEISAILCCYLNDGQGRFGRHVLGSLGHIALCHDAGVNQRYCRLVEAELALEAMERITDEQAKELAARATFALTGG